METIHGNSGYVGNGFCSNGHTFVFAGDGKIPEGYPCACGQYKAHWVKCPICGQEMLESLCLNYSVTINLKNGRENDTKRQSATRFLFFA